MSELDLDKLAEMYPADTAGIAPYVPALIAEHRDLRARLAEAEAELQFKVNAMRSWRYRAERAEYNLKAAEARLAAVRALCDDLAGDIEHSRVHGDGPPEYRAGWQHGVEFAAEQVRAVLAAVDGPTEHRPCPHPELDGYGRCLSCDEPAEGTNGDEGPYTEEQIRETFDRLGDETNQDDFMYNLRWGGPDWSNFMKPPRAAVDGPAECAHHFVDGICIRCKNAGQL